MPFCSIIVPVYKTEDYLEQCINSILNQTMRDFELILVDDGSPDRCPEMCDEYAKKEKRIQVIHKENGGVSSARNRGIKYAAGEYCWFVDSDDFVQEYSLSQFQSAVKQKEADLYVFNCKGVRDYYIGYLDDFINKYYFPYVLGFGPWNKLYRTSIIKSNKLYFDEEETIGEDLLFNLAYYQSIMGAKGRVFFLGRDYYIYNERVGSAMNTQSKDRLTQQLRLFSKARELLKKDISDDTLAYLFLLHLISGINQSRKGGIKRSDFSSIDFCPYRREIDNVNHVLRAFFQNENASVMGKARIRLFCCAMKIANYALAGRIIGLE